jgi:hypothetical protein
MQEPIVAMYKYTDAIKSGSVERSGDVKPEF